MHVRRLPAAWLLHGDATNNVAKVRQTIWLPTVLAAEDIADTWSDLAALDVVLHPFDLTQDGPGPRNHHHATSAASCDRLDLHSTGDPARHRDVDPGWQACPQRRGRRPTRRAHHLTVSRSTIANRIARRCHHGGVSDLRDYDSWHDRYDDPGSDLSWRLSRVQEHIEQFLDKREGPVRILSVCSGDGRDLLQVLAAREDTGRITATLLELHPALADRARSTAATVAPEADVAVQVVDAGRSDAYVGAVPADLVLLVGIMGNISSQDVQALIGASAQFCRPGARVVWSRGRDTSDINDDVRAWFATAGFIEVDYAALETGSRPALGLMRYGGEPVDLVPGRQLFTFWR